MLYMPCHFYQCRHALTPEMERQNVSVETLVPLDPKTAWIRPEHEPLLELLWRTYYQRVFAFFDSELGAGRYAVADVRANRYTGFEHLQGLHVPTPFGVHNDNRNPLNKPGSSWYGKTTCCIHHDPFGNPCPEETMRDTTRWDWCAGRRLYIRKSRDRRAHEQALVACARNTTPPATHRG